MTPRAVLLGRHTAVAGDEVLCSDPLAHRVQQNLVQFGAMDRQVRPLMSGRHPPRLAIDKLAVLGEERVVLRMAAARNQRVLQPERAEFLDGVRTEVDADAERLDLRRRLEHPDAVRRAGGVDGERQRQSGDPPADQNDVHAGQAPRSCRSARSQAPVRRRLVTGCATGMVAPSPLQAGMTS